MIILLRNKVIKVFLIPFVFVKLKLSLCVIKNIVENNVVKLMRIKDLIKGSHFFSIFFSLSYLLVY